MVWQLCIIAYLILDTSTGLLQRYLGVALQQYKRLVSWLYLVLFHYPMGVIVALLSSPNLGISWMNIFWLATGSAVFPAITLLILKASKTVDASRFTILSNITPIVTIAAATILLKERLNDHQLIGAAIILIAAFVITLPQLKYRDKRSKATGLLIALLVFILTGLATVYERWMLTKMDYGAYLIYGWGFQALWISLIAWPERKKINKVFKLGHKHAWAMWTYAIAGALQGVCFIVALKDIGNASLFGALTSFVAILIVPASYIFLKEKDYLWLKAGAATLGTLGLIILNTH
jgi:drug/metabolite transporter (DMT)-like permease